MHRGYVKNWRKKLESPFFRNPKLSHFWEYCLLKASHKETKVLVGYKEIILQPGQFVFGINVSALETGLSPREIRTCVSYHSTTGNLTIKSTNKFSVITIINWGIYQEDEDKTTCKSTNKRHANDTQTTTYKNDKNDKNINIPPIIPQRGTCDLPSWLPEKTFIEYIDMRKKIKKPLLEKSYQRFFTNLKNLCDKTRASPEAILNQSIINSWQGIFPLKETQNGHFQNNSKSNYRQERPGDSYIPKEYEPEPSEDISPEERERNLQRLREITGSIGAVPD